MKKQVLHNEIAGERDVSLLPTQRVAAVPSSSHEAAERQKSAGRLVSIISVFFVAIQLLLLVRFLMRSVWPANTAAWVGIMYASSSVFDLPFHLLFQWLSLSIPGGIELYTLIAILCYGLIARGLVRFCKAIIPLLALQ